ncbi:phosphohistidine phosphatase SixA [Pseudomonas sp. N040]|uniref:phosphohistidine phosphatase SixA n=1 Tax=Pseudomonas sp. N040 TaxID=2785325 RepID=UPI0018A2537D|nr:phosphohistidine phosphatase SixA [Pseudomonas sp. N040]MBF7729478.1 phosphohistidine phosphatase SixA [Pseudomonas sp. N040]MBW7013118.1 phosphohistidine phosphatase SixA [Pseudomonas sp. N040]
MKLWLLRHGQAEAHASSDAQRCLTAHGRQEVLHSAARLIGQPLQAILCSPYIRARQTAELVHEALANAPAVEIVPWLTPDSSVREVLAQLAARPESDILLVSHQPLVGELAGRLEHGHRQQPLPMVTAGLAELEGELPLAGGMRLCGQFSPR